MQDTENSNAAESASFGFREVPENEKAGLVRGVFDSVSGRYDIMNDLMSGGAHRLWKDSFFAWLAPRDGERIVDVAGGTGDIAFRMAAAAPGARIDVCDINESMIRTGRNRAFDRGIVSGLDWSVGDAEHLPFPDRTFDAYTIAFGLRNVTRPLQALKDAYRILKPGGRYFCLEFSQVQAPAMAAIYDLYSFNLLPKIGRYVARDEESYRYLAESIRMFPNQERLKDLMREAGFARVSHRNMFGGIVAIHCGWRI
jgi:demethylmenaquinone methyltransferase / 2-methoxy-6-polyprenyl-1,4-benzoquinol methylase